MFVALGTDQELGDYRIPWELHVIHASRSSNQSVRLFECEQRSSDDFWGMIRFEVTLQNSGEHLIVKGFIDLRVVFRIRLEARLA